MKTLILILCSTLFALALSELLLSLFWTNPYDGTSASNVVTLRTNAKNIDQTLDRERFDPESKTVRFRTNGDGYVLPFEQFENPDFSVAFLGGSTTEMSFVAENTRLPALVSTELAKRGVTVNTINAARSGNTLHDSINLLFNQVHLLDPDFVVIMHATNDQGLLLHDPEYRSRSATPVTTASLMRFALQSLSGRIRLFGLLRQAYTVLEARPGRSPATPPRKLTAAEARPFVARLEIAVEMTRQLGARPVLMTQPLSEIDSDLTPTWASVANQVMFNELIRSVARQRKVALVDLATALANEPGFQEAPMRFLYDGMHATDRGSTVYARLVTDKLFGLMQTPPAEQSE